MSEPMVGDRTWYRHYREGTRGFLTMVNGQRHITVDQPNNPHRTFPFIESNWIPERESRPFTRAQIAKVAFEADKALCTALQLHVPSRREWLNLRDEQRIEWMAGAAAPPKQLDGLRLDLYMRVMRLLEPKSVE